ncbi:hypothetical protein CO670_14765 [Rhizobium sp. J15]|uniref:hypothetical protein n=1 Tax=Rhizobium sp. J15 TaxID=2035450 RepID=UPI000BEA4D8A|nr:hypothetical protein [Rhizobium sp. J15]PDT16046.1 hypothetical protein CO670_14765 [Rhizobium sp. J15]
MDRQVRRDETIAESGFGIPGDDWMLEASDGETHRVKASLLRDRLDDLKDELDKQTDLAQRDAP